MRPLSEKQRRAGLICREKERNEVEVTMLSFVHAQMSKDTPTGDGDANATPANDDQGYDNNDCDVAFG